ncbi:hypothetical protein [Microbacterium capsulatum]|uniref:HTH luxR-type domain-containing protein n=1 Tax=Microbacterium capsulatum TaxID=3041921 RepID=A0ABU0XFC5_9MICO|nr:hypothetical protein [Microbacterium sp. ASV81]MDQ4213318.1 hypothetical protein [Microbacterium sp. ASV81]
MTDDDLLELLHRERLHDLDAVSARAGISVAEARARLARLARDGHLSLQDSVILLNAPAHAAALAIERLLQTERAEAAERSARLAAIVDGIARRTSAWSFGEAIAQDRIPLQTAHGPHAAEDLWFAVQSSRITPGGSVCAVLTDIERYRASGSERMRAFADAMSAYDSVRAILPAVTLDERLEELLRIYEDSSVEFRMLSNPPSWFWVDDDDVTALPMMWGDQAPHSVIAVSSPVIAGLARDCFALLWQQAHPIESDPGGYGALLQRMRRGMTLDAASRSLGITPRTGRRRISAAMERYGVSTLFALGVAWAQDGSPGAGPARG